VKQSYSFFRWNVHLREKVTGVSHPGNVVLTSCEDIVVCGEDSVTCLQRDSTGSYTTLWQVTQYGESEDKLCDPSGVCILDESVWVADNNNSQLIEFSILDGVCGQTLKLKNMPWDVAADDHRLYVSAGRDKNVCLYEIVDFEIQKTHPLKYSPDHQGDRRPWFMCFQDRLLGVCDRYTNIVNIYAVADMRLVVSLGRDTGLIDPWGVAWDPRDGSLMVADGAEDVIVFSRATWAKVERLKVEGADWLHGISIENEGRLVVTDHKNVFLYPPC
jgi:hypothetical protein